MRAFKFCRYCLQKYFLIPSNFDEKKFRCILRAIPWEFWDEVFSLGMPSVCPHLTTVKYILDCNDSLDKVNNYLVDPIFPKQIWYVLPTMQLLRLHFKECLSSWLVRLPESMCGIYLHILESGISVPSNIDVSVSYNTCIPYTVRAPL